MLAATSLMLPCIYLIYVSRCLAIIVVASLRRQRNTKRKGDKRRMMLQDKRKRGHMNWAKIVAREQVRRRIGPLACNIGKLSPARNFGQWPQDTLQHYCFRTLVTSYPGWV
jgi:hypothetical protein